MFDMFQEQSETESYSSPNPSYSRVGSIYVVSIGGSLLVKAKPDWEMLQRFSEIISLLHSQGKRIVLVVGGGKIAREYVEAMKSIGANNFEQDLMGINITRANAFLVASSIMGAHKEVLVNVADAKKILDSGKIPVFGGLMPFFTTDAVGALLAEYLGGTFVNLTNVDGIYNADPRDYPDAHRFDEIGYDNLISLIQESGSKPGQNVVLDLACCMILKRSKILGAVMDGADLGNFSNFVNNLSFTGTLIKDIENENRVIFVSNK